MSTTVQVLGVLQQAGGLLSDVVVPNPPAKAPAGVAAPVDEIGKVYGSLTRERVARIQSWTISKLRHPSRSRVLRSYLDI